MEDKLESFAEIRIEPQYPTLTKLNSCNRTDAFTSFRCSSAFASRTTQQSNNDEMDDSESEYGLINNQRVKYNLIIEVMPEP